MTNVSEEFDLTVNKLDDFLEDYLNVKNKEDTIIEFTDVQHSTLDSVKEDNIVESTSVLEDGENVYHESLPSITVTIDKFDNYKFARGEVQNDLRKLEDVGIQDIDEELFLIKRRLDQLQLESEMDTHLENSMISSIIKMQNDLSIQRKNKLQGLKNNVLKDSSDNAEVSLPNIEFSSRDSELLLLLERKVSILERSIGPTDAFLERNITTTLNSLYRRLNLLSLNDDELEQFSEKLQVVNTKYENLLLGKKSKIDTKIKNFSESQIVDLDSKVEDIYENISLLENYSKYIPRLSARIRQISHLNSNIKSSKDSIEDINKNILELESNSNEWKDILKIVETKLTEQQNWAEKYQSAMELKVQSLEQAVTNLSSHSTSL